MKHLSIKVSGKVQGVFFRASTRDQAHALGIKGFVRNERDGSVYIEAEGPEDALDKFVSWCKQGPTNAQVIHIATEEDDMKNYTKFLIKH